MWSSVVGLALLAGFNPIRLGLTLLVISRPRPIQNLVAFYIGCLTGAIPPIVVPLTLLHVTPMLSSWTEPPTPESNSTSGHIQIGIGAFALAVAVVLTVRLLTRQRVPVPAAGDPPQTDKTTAISRLLGRQEDAPEEGGSIFRRVLRRARASWENGSLWVSWLIGGVLGGPPPGEAIFLFAIIATAGASATATATAAIVYLVGMLSIIEIMLVSYWASPTKTHAALQMLHDFVTTHRHKILIAIFTVVGVTLVARGMIAI
jgi:hypothetical protein